MTRAGNIVAALEAAGERGCTTADLCSPAVGGVRFSARIMELREQGYIIRESQIRQGSHLYVLAGVESTTTGTVVPAEVPTIKSIRGQRLDGTVVDVCMGCLTNHRPGFVCPHGRRTERMELGAGPRDQPCQRARLLANRPTETETRRAA